jgi:hypothetical protein
MSADFLERELIGPYKFTPHQVKTAASCELKYSALLATVPAALRHVESTQNDSTVQQALAGQPSKA